MDENSEGTLKDIPVDFDDLIAFDCVIEHLREYQKTLAPEDSQAVTRWTKTMMKMGYAIEQVLENG
jgi:hypothetical protein